MIAKLNLDHTFPVEDSHHATNTAGVIRFLNITDPFHLPVFNRVFGDVVNRFILIEEALNGMVLELTGNPLFKTFDDSPYIKTDATRPFLNPIAGVDPVTADHLVTKRHSDQQVSEVLQVVGDLETAFNEYRTAGTRPFYSAWRSHVWDAGLRQHVVFPLVETPGITPNFADLTSVALIEKVNIAQPSVQNPTPPPIYRYQTLVTGSETGFRIDACWLDPETRTVHAAIPNRAFYPSYAGVADQGGLSDLSGISSPIERWLRAVVYAPVA